MRCARCFTRDIWRFALNTLPSTVAEALGSYVYRLVDPRDGATFYVGKGRGDRASAHARDALATAEPGDRLDRIRAIHAAGLEVGVVVHRHGMDEATALHVEAALIDVYAEAGLTNLVRGHGSEFGPATLEELRARYAAPDAVIDFPAIIIKIERQWTPALTPGQLYERTRRYWKANPARHRPRPTHALSVARGIVREVYRIEGWEEYRSWPADRDLSRILDAEEDWSEGHLRRGFRGEPDPALADLLGCSVRHITLVGTQNPIRYVNC
jgi:uncharacterized protein